MSNPSADTTEQAYREFLALEEAMSEAHAGQEPGQQEGEQNGTAELERGYAQDRIRRNR